MGAGGTRTRTHVVGVDAAADGCGQVELAVAAVVAQDVRDVAAEAAEHAEAGEQPAALPRHRSGTRPLSARRKRPPPPPASGRPARRSSPSPPRRAPPKAVPPAAQAPGPAPSRRGCCPSAPTRARVCPARGGGQWQRRQPGGRGARRPLPSLLPSPGPRGGRRGPLQTLPAAAAARFFFLLFFFPPRFSPHKAPGPAQDTHTRGQPRRRRTQPGSAAQRSVSRPPAAHPGGAAARSATRANNLCTLRTFLFLCSFGVFLINYIKEKQTNKQTQNNPRDDFVAMTARRTINTQQLSPGRGEQDATPQKPPIPN